MFGRPEAIRDWRTRHLIDYRLVPGDEASDTRWDDRVAWDGNLFGAFETIYNRLASQLPTPFRLEGSTRLAEGNVHIALREALVNLLVHADYAETQASLIKASPEGYLFRNPGSSRVTEADLLLGDRSDPRNPEIVFMFRQIGLAEEAGTGMPKIIKAWRELGFRMPAIDIGTERYEFSLELRHVHLLSEEDRDWLHALGTGWTEPEQLALVMARHEGTVDNLTLRNRTGQHPADVTRVLRGLRDRGFLRMMSGGRGARYELVPIASVPSVGLGIGGIAAESKATAAIIEGSGPSIEGNGSSIEGKDSGLEGIQSGTIGKGSKAGTLPGRLEEIARPALEKARLTPDLLDQILVQLCAQMPLSLNELAQLTNRSELWIRECVRRLLTEGRLSYLYPRQPRHPQQKYVAEREVGPSVVPG